MNKTHFVTNSPITSDLQRETTRELTNAGAPLTSEFLMGLVKGASSGSFPETHLKDLQASHSMSILVRQLHFYLFYLPQ